MAKNYGTKTTRAVKEHLKQLGERVIEVAEAATEENAKLLVDEMKKRVPVETGRLRDSIHYVRGRTDKDGFVNYKIVVDASNDDYKYAKIVEFSPKINKPFMYPAFDALRATMKENVKDAIRKAVKN